MQNAENFELTRNQKRALWALLESPTIRAAALACGLSERTLYVYLKHEPFVAALREEQDSLTAATTAALAGGTGLALDTLQAVMMDKNETGATRVRAAVAWLKAWRDAVEIDDLTKRIEALEERER